MRRHRIFRIFLMLLLMGTLAFAFNAQFMDVGTAVYVGDVYIKSDGSIYPSDAPIQTTDNITYTLTDDINGSIIIERDNITLDGAGYTVQGSGTGNGIDLSNRNNVTIKNLNIKNFKYGIHLYYSSNITIIGNNISSNSYYGIALFYSSNNTISGNNILNNTHHGIYLYKSSDNTISNNNISDNTDDGIYIYDSCSNNIVSGNNITSNDDDGIALSASSNNVISNNNITSNGGDGIFLSDSSNNTISGNNILNNTNIGVYLYASSNNVISNNNITSNGDYGIYVFYGSSNNIISNNNISDNANDGIYVRTIFDGYSNNNTILGNNIINNTYGIYLYKSSDNTISNNNVLNNTYDGIRLYYSCSDNTISNNNVSNNNYGIYIYDSSGNTISGNIVSNNDDYGIYLHISSNNNTVSGNNVSGSSFGIGLYDSSNNIISGNTVSNNNYGLYLSSSSSNNTFFENNVSSNYYGVKLSDSSDNVFYHNNFIGNTHQVTIAGSSINTWDNGYPSGGNYWSDYSGVDEYKGANQDEPGVDGIGDTPYIIDANNKDRYPLIKPWKTMIWTVPSSGPTGTKVTVIGYDFSSGSQVTVTFNDMLLGHVVCEGERFIFTFNIPVSSAGEQLVKAQDTEGNYADTTFTVIDGTSLDLQIEVGTIHFRGEVAEFYVLTSFKGEPVNVTITEATLYYANGTLTGDLTGSIEQIATGLYRIPYEIPLNAPEGTYTLFVKAEYVTSTISSKGVSFESFLVSPTLTDWNAYLVEIKDNVAVIKTDVGDIKVKLDDLNATIIALRGDVAVLNTTLGEIEAEIKDLNATLIDVKNRLAVFNTTLGRIEAKLDDLNATLIAVKNDVIFLKTALGEIEVKLDNLNATLIEVKDDLVVLNTTLGEIKAEIEDLNVTLVALRGDVAVLNTALGEIEVKLDDLNVTLIAVALDVEDMKETFQSWTGVTSSVSGYTLLTLTSSELVVEPTVTDSVVELRVSGPDGTSGTTLIVVQKDLLETLGATIDDVVVLIDMKQVEFEAVEYPTYYLVKIFYTHSEHTVTIHLTGGLDSDSDGIPNWKEYVTGTSPTKPDTDKDLWKDSVDPWPTNSLLPNGIITAIPIIAIIFVLKRKRK